MTSSLMTIWETTPLMLFDLRGRGRRRTVQAIYLGLAILLGGGLIFFGVGENARMSVCSVLAPIWIAQVRLPSLFAVECRLVETSFFFASVPSFTKRFAAAAPRAATCFFVSVLPLATTLTTPIIPGWITQ